MLEVAPARMRKPLAAMRSLLRPGANRSQRRRIAAALLLLAAVALAARSLTYTAWYQDRLYARMGLERLAEAARRQPGNAIALYYYGRALDAKGRFAEALVPLEHAAGLDPDEARIRGEWSTAQLAGGYITGAFGQLTQFARTHPDSAEGHLLLGRFYVAQNSYIRATEELEQAVRLDPNAGEAWSLLAGARMQMGGLALARDAARKAVALRPGSAVDHMLLAFLLQATDDRNGACREMAAAVALAPNDSGYQCEYARILEKGGEAGDLARAEQAARRAIALNPRAADAYYALGRALAQQGKPAAALEPLKTAATLLPPGTPRSSLAANAPEQYLDPAPALELARAYQALGHKKEAATWEARYLRRQQRAEEERRLSDAIRNHPDQPAYRRQMALLLARRGDAEGVVKNLARLRQTAPDAPMVLAETADLLSTAGYGGLAVPLARRATVFSKNSPAAYEAYGNALLAMGQAHAAAVKYAKAAGWWPQNMRLYKAKIAATYRQRQQHPSEAETLYRQALDLERAGLGLPFNNDRVKVLITHAVVLEPANTDYRRYLLQVLVSRRERVEAEQVARDLVTLSPEDGLGQALLAVLLLERADSDRYLPEAETHLKAAEEDASVLPAVHYGQGLLALRRGQGLLAVRLLRLSLQEAPAESTYYQLAQAERLAGDPAAAAQAMTQFTSRVDRDRQAIALMQRIAARPNDRQRYAEAIRYYMQHGMKAQAAAIQMEARRRFGTSRS